jgi:hypothetical protein
MKDQIIIGGALILLAYVAIYFIFRLQAKAWIHEISNYIDHYINTKLNPVKDEENEKQ